MSPFLFLKQRLSNAYDSLAKAYKKVVDVMGTGKRLLGKYFRVAFFGQVNWPIKKRLILVYNTPNSGIDFVPLNGPFR